MWVHKTPQYVLWFSNHYYFSLQLPLYQGVSSNSWMPEQNGLWPSVWWAWTMRAGGEAAQSAWEYFWLFVPQSSSFLLTFHSPQGWCDTTYLWLMMEVQDFFRITIGPRTHRGIRENKRWGVGLFSPERFHHPQKKQLFPIAPPPVPHDHLPAFCLSGFAYYLLYILNHF